MPFISHRFGKTFYLSKGRMSEDRLPIIGLHGGPGGTHAGMKPLLKLANERKVYIYDQIGGGKSSPTKPSKWNIETFVEELRILRHKWKLDEFHLYGASWGTTLALEYYLRTKGDGVRSITFQSPLFSTKIWMQDAARLQKQMPAKYQKIIKYCHEIGATDSAVYKEALYEYYVRFVFRDRKKLMKALNPSPSKKRASKPNPGNAVYQFMWGPSEFGATGTLKKYDRLSDLSKVKVPVQLYAGRYDEATPEATQKFAKRFPNARCKIIPKSAHAVLAEQPVPLLKDLRKFLYEVDCLE